MKNLNPLFDYLSTIKKIQNSIRVNIPQINIPGMELINSMVKLNEQIMPHVDFGTNLQKQIINLPFPQIELSRELTQKIDIIKSINIPNALSLYGNEYSRIEKIQKYFSSTIDLCTQIGLYSFDEKQIDNELNSVIEILPQKKMEEITKEDIIQIKKKLDNGTLVAFSLFIIQVLIAFYFEYRVSIQPSSSDSKKNETQVNLIEQDKQEVLNEFSKTLGILCLEQRQAKINTFVRIKPSSKSSIISTIEERQIVFVQQIQHKWIYIVYQDSDYIIKSGWALKKQFER